MKDTGLAKSDITFAAAPFDRAGHLRKDAAYLSQAWREPSSRLMHLKGGQVLVKGAMSEGMTTPGAPIPKGPRQIVWTPPDAAQTTEERALFLGRDEHEAALFAVDCSDSEETPPHGAFEDVRAAASGLPAEEAHLLAAARAVFAWHDRHGFCANCGTPTQLAEAGWKRVCEACGAEHFPRVDPVAIMLAVKDDKCLMGRQSNWPPGFWSCLAGFIEPGETPEQGAARELFEEAGIRSTGEVRYLFSQPWPFPSNLMIGLILEAANEDVLVDKSELEDARWFTREEARAIIERRHPDVFAPPPTAIAHHILKVWAEESD